MGNKFYDLIVVGAGPAGSTLSTLVKKYNPRAKILIVEKTVFPRHHIGESFLVGSNPVLREMGVFDKINVAGFLKKIGATFIWGKDRTPWDINFNSVNKDLPEEFWLDDAEFSWQALRSEYDAVLLRHALEMGVEARLHHCALAPRVSASGKIHGVVIDGPRGPEQLDCAILADCSGQNGFLSRFCKTRSFRQDLRNMAMYAYFKGAPWKYRYQGDPEKTKIFVCSVSGGWFWYIPLSRDLVSVGLVSKLDCIKKQRVSDLRAYFLEAIQKCPEISSCLQKAPMIKGIDEQNPEKDFFAISDFSYQNETACGDGWLAAGDAAFFVDPILSTGVALAHLSGHRAAYSISTAWKAKDPAARRLIWEDYNRFCKEIGGGVLALVHYWYGYDPNARRWWKKAGQELRTLSPFKFSDKVSFVAIAAGLTYYLERSYLKPTPPLFESESEEWYGWLWQGNMHGTQKWASPDLWLKIPPYLLNEKTPNEDDRVRKAKKAVLAGAISKQMIPHWKKERSLETTFVPDSSRGLLRPIHRLVFKTRAQSDGMSATADPKRILPLSYLNIVNLIDGKRTVFEILQAVLRSCALPKEVIDARVFRLLKDLTVLDLIEMKESPPALKAHAPRKKSWSLFRAGEEALLVQGEAQKAEAHLSRAISSGRKEAWVYALRGEARRHLGRLKEALSDSDRAVAFLDLKNRFLSDSSLASCLKSFDEKASRGEMEGKIRLFRAVLFIDLGNKERALREVEMTLRLNPKHSEAFLLQAKIMREMGDRHGARAALQSALMIQKETAAKA